MDFKWLKTAYQFDGEPSGGTVDPPAGDPPPTPDLTGDPGAPPADPSAGDPEPPPPTTVAAPDDLLGRFAPPPAATYQLPQAAAPPPVVDPPTPAPPRVDPPSADEWELDPGKAAAKYQDHMAWKLHSETQPLKDTIARQDQSARGEAAAEFQRKSLDVQHAWKVTGKAVEGFYAKTSIFNQDADFRANPELQTTVKEMLDYCITKAYNEADQTGDASRLMDIATNPRFQQRLLHAAKGELRTVDPAMRPTATPTGPQARATGGADALDEDDDAALAEANKEGYGYTREQLRAAKKMQGGV